MRLFRGKGTDYLRKLSDFIWTKSAKIRPHAKRLIYFLRTSDASYFLIFSVLVGLGGGFGAILFRWMILQFRNLFFVKGGEILDFMGKYHVILLPALGGLIVGPLIYYFAREAKGHGVPEVMRSVLTGGGKIRPRVAAVKALASSICIGSGGSVGRSYYTDRFGTGLSNRTTFQAYRGENKDTRRLRRGGWYSCNI
jgi:CIC family chloride channel protein